MLSQNEVADRLSEDTGPWHPGQQLFNLPESDWAGWQDVGQQLGRPAALVEEVTRRALLSPARCCARHLLQFCELTLT